MATDQELESPRNSASYLVMALVAALAILLAIYVRTSHTMTATTYFADAIGLKPGAAVNLGGVDIGEVKSVTLTTAPEHKHNPVQVVMKLDSRFQPSLHVDSVATLESVGALGDTSIDISSESAGGPTLQDGGELRTQTGSNIFDMTSAKSTMRDIQTFEDRSTVLANRFDTGKGTSGQLLSNPQLKNQLAAINGNVQQLTAKLSSNSNSAGKFLNDPTLGNNITTTTKDVQAVAASAGKLTSGQVQDSLATTSKLANAVIADAKSGDGSIGLLTKDPAKLSGTLAKTSALVTSFTSNPKTGGNFAPGGTTQVDIQKLQTESAGLFTAIRQNPKKFFSISVRIF